MGDLSGNATRILEGYTAAVADGAQLCVTPELAVSGYPPEDLLLRTGFIDQCATAAASIADHVGPVPLIIGTPLLDGGRLSNAALVLRNGEIVDRYFKRVLPNYGVFDERRYFAVGQGSLQLVETDGVKVAIAICEDVWDDHGPLADYQRLRPDLVVVLNASPFDHTKDARRRALLSRRAAQIGVPIVYVNAVGAQDELIFDGASLVADVDGNVTRVGARFKPSTVVVDTDNVTVGDVTNLTTNDESWEPAVWQAIVLAITDYVNNNGFSRVVIGLSGGVDSALVAVLAVQALGSDNVECVAMPSRYSSGHSLVDARQLATVLGCTLREIPIEPMHVSFEESVGPFSVALTDENLQSRIRGTTLMAVSSERNALVLTTGNKSEIAVGYSTLYGDTAGAFAPIKDLYKTDVYRLASWYNAQTHGAAIPQHILDKPPSAELRPDQTDQDSLPDYDTLDRILALYIEDDQTVGEIVAGGVDRTLAQRIASLVDRAEFKRRQSPLGPKLTTKAFGRDRRVPITSKFPG